MRQFMSRPHPWIMQAIGGMIAVGAFAVLAVVVFFLVFYNQTEKAAPAPLAPPVAAQQPSSGGGGQPAPTSPASQPGTGATSGALTWSNVHAIFAANCTPCHIGGSLAGLNLDTYASAMKGGSIAAGGVVNGAVIKPGNAADSFLYLAVAGKQGSRGARMPFGRNPLPQSDIQTIYKWIQAGAKD